MPGITIDRDAGVVDLDATVVFDQRVVHGDDGQVLYTFGAWLELIACSPGTREHETIVTVTAPPSQIHLALLLLGLKPGHPMRVTPDGEDGFKIIPPEGPPVGLFFVWTDRAGDTHEVPANRWVLNRKTGKPMEGNRWLFTGSARVDYNGKHLYMADLNGTVASLVNFRDDLLGRDTKLTSQNDDQLWQGNEKAIPPPGTELTLRLRPPPPEAKPPDGVSEASPASTHGPSQSGAEAEPGGAR